MPRSLRARRGFTTIELAVVIIMVGVLFAIALPRIRVDAAAVDGAARTLSLAVLSAQRDAVARSHNVLLRFDQARHTVTAVWDVDNNGRADEGEKTRPFLLPEVVRFGLPPGVPPLEGAEATLNAEDEAEVVVVLQRNGAADRTHTLYLTSARALIKGDELEARALRIARATGRPGWYAWTGDAWRIGR